MSETKRNHPRRIQEFAAEIADIADQVDEAGAAIPARLDAGPLTAILAQAAHDVARDTAELVIALRAVSAGVSDLAAEYASVDMTSVAAIQRIQQLLDEWERGAS